jgi:peptidoglycan/xylan/chitin deacetylase (PgdA/CDA1 family)
MTERRLPRTSSKALALMYHRVANETCDPWALCVSPSRFEEQMAALRQAVRVLPLQQLRDHLAAAADQLPSVIVTFDDGYADNFHTAKPVLERYEVPATFFIVSGHVGQPREFWWDELDRLLLQPVSLPASFRLDLDGSVLDADLTGATEYAREDYERNWNWRAWDPPPTPRHALYYSLWQRLQPMTETDRQQALDAIRRWAGIDPHGRGSHLAMASADLATLARHPLIEVGCHTQTHPRLSSLPVLEQSVEIRGCKDYLERFLKQPVKSFAYPYGGLDDYTAETSAVVREIGFSTACSTSSGIVTASSDLFELPRIAVENWNGEEFAHRLAGWLGGPPNKV